MKKILALILALALVLGLATVAFAADEEAEVTKGSITIQNATKGYEYKAYKVFDATYDGDAVSYKTPAANAQYLDNTLFGWSTVADEDGNISVWKLANASDANVITWVENNYSKFGGQAIDGVFDDTNSTVTFSNLDFGYYYITSGLGSTVTIDTANPTAQVYDKNNATDAPPEKTIVSVDGEEVANLEETDAHVGSVIGFEITAITTNWVYDAENADGPEDWVIRENWSVTDTPTSMEIDVNSVEVYVNGEKITEGYEANINEKTGELTVTIDMKDDDGNSIYEANHGENPGQIPIRITYTATITKDAGETPAKNEIPGTIIKVKTYQFDLSKVDENEEALKGAKFEVYRVEDDAEPILLTFSMNEEEHYVYDPEGTITQIDLTKETIATITGLDKWNLVLKEVVVPAGYNQAEDTNVPSSSLKEVGDDTVEAVITVINQKGLELPSTGGIGTTIFYIVGSMMAVGAGIVLVTKKRIGVEA